eukprot:gene11316-12502_t
MDETGAVVVGLAGGRDGVLTLPTPTTSVVGTHWAGCGQLETEQLDVAEGTEVTGIPKLVSCSTNIFSGGYE